MPVSRRVPDAATMPPGGPPPIANILVESFLELLSRTFSQDVARRNAGQAAIRLGHRRRQQEEVEAFLAQLPCQRMPPPETNREAEQHTEPPTSQQQ